MNHVLITGATSGIGEALTHELIAANKAQEALQIYACGRNQQKLDLLAQDEQIESLAFDITDKEAITSACNSLPDLDLVILNAGDCEYVDDVKAFDGDLFARIIQINLVAMGYLLASLLPKVKAGGRIVLVSSSATILPFPRAEAYGASKAGLDYLAQSLRLDLMKEDISVTLVHPGFIKTPLTDKNNFAMPFIISSEEAAKRIIEDIQKGKDYIQFPKRLTYLLKFFAILPDAVWQSLILRSSKA